MKKSVLFFLFSAAALWIVGCENGGPGSETLSFDACRSTPGIYTGNLTSNGLRESFNFLEFGSCTEASGSVDTVTGTGIVTLTCGGTFPLRCVIENGVVPVAPAPGGCGFASPSELSDAQQSVAGILDPDPFEPWLDCEDAPAGTLCNCNPTGTVITSYL